MVRSDWPSGSGSLNPQSSLLNIYFRLSIDSSPLFYLSISLTSKYLFASLKSVARNLSDMWRSTFKRSARRSWINQENEVYSLTKATGDSLKKKDSWMKSASSFREDWECRFPLDHYHRNLAIWGRTDLQKGSPPAPFESAGNMAKEAELPFAMQLACKQRKYLTKKLDRCFVNGSRPTGEILVSWCANTKTYEAVRYFGNEQLTTLSTVNRACEERQCL